MSSDNVNEIVRANALIKAQEKLREAKLYGGPDPFDGACFTREGGAAEAAAKVIEADRELFRAEGWGELPVHEVPAWGEFDEKEQNLAVALEAVQAAVAHLPPVAEDMRDWDFPVPDATCRRLVRLDWAYTCRYLRGVVSRAEAYERTHKSLLEALSAPKVVQRALGGGWVVDPNLMCAERAQFHITHYAKKAAEARAAEAVDRAALTAAIARMSRWGETTFYPLYDALCRAYGVDEERDAFPTKEIMTLINAANRAAEEWRYYVIDKMTVIISLKVSDTDLVFEVRPGQAKMPPTNLDW